jgi:catechol 2,3-dioxygenase-like lactoylglutathione lyase family enzyme
MAETGTRGSVLRRATIFVRDLDAAVAFYSEAFGFERYYARDMDLSVIGDVPFGDEGRGGSMRFAIVRGLDPLLGMIGLIEICDPPLPPVAETRLRQGNAFLVIETDDIARAARVMAAHGCRIVRPPTEGRNIGDADGQPFPAKVMFAFDPDGQILEVFEPT